MKYEIDGELELPDYIYDSDNWECAYSWKDRDEILDTLYPDDGVIELGTLIQGPWLYAVAYEGDDGFEIVRLFTDKAKAEAFHATRAASTSD